MSSSYKKKALSIAVTSVMAGMIPTMALAQDDAANNSLEEIEVIGIKGQLRSAQQLKRDANTVIDAITASDIGALPDKSVTEALQRVPGVTIERFDSPTDPNHPALEGAGVVVRGLKRTRSEFNGRDSYSAGNDGTGLSYQDVTPELLSRIEISKNATASQIAGGVAGTVNLITRKPFDNDDRLIAFSGKYSHNDFSGENSPSFSGLFSDRWTNDAGEFGLLISYADTELESRGDSLAVDNFYLRTADADKVAFAEPASNPLSAFPDQDLIMPAGVTLQTNSNIKERQGVATSLQWKSPNDMIVATAEYLRSDSTQSWRERNIGQQQQGFGNDQRIQLVGDGSDAIFLDGSTRGLDYDYFVQGSVAPGYLRAASRVNTVDDLIEDSSLHVTITPTDRLTIDLDAQYINSTHDSYNFTLSNTLTPEAGAFPSNAYFLDLTGGTPNVQFLEQQAINSDSQAFINTVNGNLRDSTAESKAFAADVEYTFDEGWITSVQGGAYFSDRDQTVRDNEYANWGAVSCAWCTGGVEPTGAVSNPQYHDLVSFGDFMDGGVLGGNVNSFFFPKFGLFEDIDALFDTFNDGLITAWGAENPFDLTLRNRDGFRPSEIAETTETKQEAYVQVNWALEDLDMPLRGNFGLRYVSYEVDSTGAVSFPSELASDDPRRPFLTAEQLAFMTTPDATFSTASSDYSTVLPSFNVNMSVTDDIVARFAVSKGIFFPRPRDIRNVTSISYSGTNILQNPSEIQNPDTNPVVGVENVQFTAFAQNPYLEPEESINYDVTLEWYFADVGSLTGSLFYKDLSNLSTQGIYSQEVTNPANGATQVVNFQGPVNGGDGTVQGFELSYVQTFDFLPGEFDGLGAQFNYTYIDQDGLGDVLANPAQSTIITGATNNRNDFRNFSDLPMPGYSDESMNAVLFYEKHDISARLAYSWRSEYLLTNLDADNQVPVYADAYGQFDGSIFYRLNENIELGFEAANITEEETTTRVQYNQAGVTTPRSFSYSGSTYSLVFKANF